MENIMTQKTSELVTVSFNPINEVPLTAPPVKVDLMDPNLSFDDVLPANYFSMEDLQIWLDERGAESRILTVTSLTMEYVYDPEKGEATGEWKPCMQFAETGTMLVINKTRGQQLKRMTGSPYLRDWASAGAVAIKPGIGNGKAQIVFTAIPAATAAPEPQGDSMADEPLEDLNDELFG
jgi:hypothetical protein